MQLRMLWCWLSASAPAPSARNCKIGTVVTQKKTYERVSGYKELDKGNLSRNVPTSVESLELYASGFFGLSSPEGTHPVSSRRAFVL